MKENIHPEYKKVVFEDITANHRFICRSTMSSREKVTLEDGEEYPLIQVEVSSASHPFYTGEKVFIDTAGRVEKFKNRYTTITGAKRKTRKAKPEKKQ